MRDRPFNFVVYTFLFSLIFSSWADAAPKDMVLIAAGFFTMGSAGGTSDEKPTHEIFMDAFYMDKFPVTFGQYDKFCGATGRKKVADQGWGRGRRPVISIDWHEAGAYCKWAKKRLPTEAEYEKAASALGGINELQATPIGDYAWYGANSGGKTHPVGQKLPNGYGLYDMVGNVLEWCSDWYGADYYSRSPGRDPQGPAGGTTRVLRGASWKDPSAPRTWDRFDRNPDASYVDAGCRCAETP
jgi:formylglycine-generating enzyme required for sulfatase activity